jgi:hypothetical protein
LANFGPFKQPEWIEGSSKLKPKMLGPIHLNGFKPPSAASCHRFPLSTASSRLVHATSPAIFLTTQKKKFIISFSFSKTQACTLSLRGMLEYFIYYSLEFIVFIIGVYFPP